MLKVLHRPKTTLLVAALSVLTVWLLSNWRDLYDRSMKATCCICHRRCRGFPQRRRRVMLEKPTSPS
ncbi:hypothetical protein ACLB1R_16495 [Escherichia coli]